MKIKNKKRKIKQLLCYFVKIFFKKKKKIQIFIMPYFSNSLMNKINQQADKQQNYYIQVLHVIFVPVYQ